MHKMLLRIPRRLETERLVLRCYKAGDGPMYYAVGRKNWTHLRRYESENVVTTLDSEQEAEVVVRELAADWLARNCFFLGAFEKTSGEFVAQVYIGPLNWELPEFEIGFFADVDHEGQGFVTEAVEAALRFIFEHLGAHRVSTRCDDTNVRSYRLAERCGFRREGLIRENRRNPDGTLSGTLHYGLLRGEFEAQMRP